MSGKTDDVCGLSARTCKPCRDASGLLDRHLAVAWLEELSAWNAWTMTMNGQHKMEGATLQRLYSFETFKEAMTFVNLVAEIAEAEGHHPDISIERYKFVKLKLTTHSANGLTENDFIVAAKCDAARATMAK